MIFAASASSASDLLILLAISAAGVDGSTSMTDLSGNVTFGIMDYSFNNKKSEDAPILEEPNSGDFFR